MRRAGLEPARRLVRRILSPVCLPIPPSPQMRVIHPLKIYKEKQRKITKEKLKESYKKL
jgi:hypothetical protein